MARVKETRVAGTAYSRCDQMSININDNGRVEVLMSEVDLLEVDGEAGKPRRERSDRSFRVILKGATAVPLVDPETWGPTGDTLTMEELRRGLIGLYVAQSAAQQP